MSNFKAILFDYAGVLADEGFKFVLDKLAKEQGLEVDNMWQEGTSAIYDSGYMLGRGSEADFWDLLRKRTGLKGADADHRDQVLKAFTIRPWMLELVSKLKRQGYVTGILSDHVDWLDELEVRDQFYGYFDCIYNSYTMGKGKRDPSQFSDVAADLGLEPSDVLFIDDTKSHVARAESVGMTAIQFIDRETLIQDLRSMGFKVV